MNFKNSQISLFMIIGIIILIIGVVLINVKFFNTETLMERQITNLNVPLEYRGVWENVAKCIDSEFQRIIEEVGMQGGYYYAPLDSMYEDGFYIAPHIRSNFYIVILELPDLTFIESEIINGLEDSFNACKKSIDNGIYQIVEKGEPKFSISRSLEGTRINLDYPLEIISKDKNFLLNDYYVDYDIELNKYIEISHKLADEVVKEPNMIPLSFLETLIEDYSVNITVTTDREYDIYYINDSKALTFFNGFVYRFAVLRSENYPPVLITEEITMYENKVYEGYIDFIDYEADFAYILVDSFFYVNNETGFVFAEPNSSYIGVHEVPVLLTDGDKEQEYTLIVEVIESDDPPIIDEKSYTIKAGTHFNEKIVVFDEYEDILSYSLIDGPEGFVVSGNMMFWIAKNPGSYPIIIEVSDSVNTVQGVINIDVVQTYTDTPVKLIAPDSITCTVGVRCYYNIDSLDPDGDEPEFSDDSNIFDINLATGEIDFVPINIGVYNVNISVKDSSSIDSKIVKVVIE
jgi:hypothetical protein